MMKKEYMTPELEEFELEFESPLMDLSTDNGEDGNGYSDEDIEGL
jgi:hypothetical protein